MTKQEFLDHLAELYRTGNRSESDDRPADEAWTHGIMAGNGCCAAIDDIMGYLKEFGVITADEDREFYANL